MRSRTIDETAVLDFGYAEGEEGAMEALLAHFLKLTHELGRNQLIIPLDELPELASIVARYAGIPETRLLRYSHPSVKLERVFTDLRFW
jgi:hypothetical protein